MKHQAATGNSNDGIEVAMNGNRISQVTDSLHEPHQMDKTSLELVSAERSEGRATDTSSKKKTSPTDSSHTSDTTSAKTVITLYIFCFCDYLNWQCAAIWMFCSIFCSLFQTFICWHCDIIIVLFTVLIKKIVSLLSESRFDLYGALCLRIFFTAYRISKIKAKYMPCKFCKFILRKKNGGEIRRELGLLCLSIDRRRCKYATNWT